MTLTALRRVVMAANGLAILAAGAAAWFSLRAEPAAARDWPKIFPAKKTDAGTSEVTGPGPKDEYTASISWPQGSKPVPVDDTPKAPPAPVDLFKSKYRLNGVFMGLPNNAPSYAQLKLSADGAEVVFSVRVGERIQQEPTALQIDPVLTPWLLVEVREWDGKGSKAPCAADFVNIQTGEKQTLEMIAGNTVSLENPPSKDIPPFGNVDPSGRPPRGQQLRARPVRLDPAAGVMEWILDDPEVDYLDAWGDDQAKEISAVSSKDADGKPDGFILKAVKAGSRAEAYGFKPEDKIISVNGEKVVSTENAVATGKKQHEGGAKTFQVKALRAGKEMNFTFHAPEKKKGKAKS